MPEVRNLQLLMQSAGIPGNTALPRDASLRAPKDLIRDAAAIVGIWLLIALVTATQTYLAAKTEGRAETWMSTFSYTAAVDALWAAFTPPILWLTGRFPLSVDRAWRSIFVHLAAGTAIASLHVALYVLIFGRTYHPGADLDAHLDLFLRKIASNIYINLLTYTVIVGLVSAVRAYRALHAEQIAAANLREQLARAEANALRAQLQPHFLFNTLNATSALIRSDPLTAERLIARIGDLLRMSLEDLRSPETTVADELKFTDAFLAIEQLRLGARLRIERRIDPKSLHARLPSLLVQPIVENAVRHGIAPSVEGGTIQIEVGTTATALYIRIANDGMGTSDIEEKVGLGTTRARLQQRYGGRALMEVDARNGSGFEVSIRIPL